MLSFAFSPNSSRFRRWIRILLSCQLTFLSPVLAEKQNLEPTRMGLPSTIPDEAWIQWGLPELAENFPQDDEFPITKSVYDGLKINGLGVLSGLAVGALVLATTYGRARLWRGRLNKAELKGASYFHNQQGLKKRYLKLLRGKNLIGADNPYVRWGFLAFNRKRVVSELVIALAWKQPKVLQELVAELPDNWAGAKIAKDKAPAYSSFSDSKYDRTIVKALQVGEQYLGDPDDPNFSRMHRSYLSEKEVIEKIAMGRDGFDLKKVGLTTLGVIPFLAAIVAEEVLFHEEVLGIPSTQAAEVDFIDMGPGELITTLLQMPDEQRNEAIVGNNNHHV